MLRERLQDQHLFLKVFDDAPIGMVLSAPNGEIMKVNESLCRMLGYSTEELTNLTVQSITYPEDLPQMDIRQKAISGEIDSYRLEKRYIHKSGEIIWGLLSVTVERDEHGNLGFFISQVVDISEQKKKEEESKEIKELHQLISEHSQDIIIRCTPEGIVNYVSPSVCYQLGYQPEELIGKCSFDFIHPDDLDPWFNQDNQDYRLIIYRARHKNGGYVWLEAQYKIVRNAARDVEHLIAIIRDITERKKAERLLEEREQRHKSLLKYTPVGICSVDTEGNFTEVNPAYEKITGYSAEELLSMNFKELIFPEHLIHVEEQFRNCLERDCYFEGTPLRHKDGSEIISIAWSSPIILNQERVGVYLVTKDITEQKQTEELLKRSEQLSMVGELAAGIAHEIRNPLTSIRGFVQLFKKEDTSGIKRSRHEVMLSEIDRINEIVSELLVLAKPVHETRVLGNIADNLNHVVTLFEGQANLYNVQIIKEFDTDLPLILCHNTLKQVFINVLKNAIESMPKGGEVRIIAKRMEDKVCVQITDQGCGISADILTKIGSPFYTTKETGTGLGIMVSQRIIQNHKGTMRIESEVGKGTTVEIMLPVG